MDVNMPFSVGVLNAFKFNLVLESTAVHKRTATDYELDYYIGGNRKMSINGNEFTVGNGSVIFRKPGDYCISSGTYNCYSLTLDFSGKKQNLYGNYDRNNSDNTMQEICTNPLLELIPSHFISKHSSDYVKIYNKLAYNTQNINSKETDTILVNQLLFLILSDVCYTIHNETDNNSENRVLTETCKYIQENFHKNISIKELANNVSLSPSYFLKMFKKNANTTPTEYIISIRLSNAKQLLTESNLTVSQIAEQCGFNDASYFSYYFRRHFGIKPSEYRVKENSKSMTE